MKKGREDAFAEILARYQTRIRGYCGRILSKPAEAEDAAQEVFIKVFQHVQDFKGDSLFSTWLYRVALNHCRDKLRQSARTRAESWEALTDKERQQPSLSEGSPSFEKTLEDRNFLQHVLSLISEEHREVLILREGQDLSYEQITDVLGCSLDTVKTRIKRARLELMEKARHFFKQEDVNTTGNARKG